MYSPTRMSPPQARRGDSGRKADVEVVSDGHVERVQREYEEKGVSPPGWQPRHRRPTGPPQHEESHRHAGNVGAARDRLLGPEERDHRGDDEPGGRSQQVGDAQPLLIAVRAWRRGERDRPLDAGPPNRQVVAGVGIRWKAATEVDVSDPRDTRVAVPCDERVAGLKDPAGRTPGRPARRPSRRRDGPPVSSRRRECGRRNGQPRRRTGTNRIAATLLVTSTTL